MSRITRTTIRKIIKEEGGESFPLVHIMNDQGQFAKTVHSGYEISFAIQMPFSEARSRRVVRRILERGDFQLKRFPSGDSNPTIDQDSLGHFRHVIFTVEDRLVAGRLVALDPKDHRAGFTLKTKWTPPLPPEVKADIWGPSNERIGWIDSNGEPHYDGFESKRHWDPSDAPLILTREERRMLKDEIILRHALSSLPAIVGSITIEDVSQPPVQMDGVQFELIESEFDSWTYDSIDRLMTSLGWTLYSAEPDATTTEDDFRMIFEADRLKPGYRGPDQVPVNS